MTEGRTPESDEGSGDNSPHTTPEEGHPAGDGERNDREVGGPTPPDSPPEEDVTGGATGRRPTEGFDSHE